MSVSATSACLAGRDMPTDQLWWDIPVTVRSITNETRVIFDYRAPDSSASTRNRLEGMRAFTGTGPTSRRLEHRFKGDNVYRKNRSARLALHTDGMHGHHALARDMLSMRTRSWSSHPRSTGLQIVQSHAQQDFADSPTYQDLNVRTSGILNF